jgi:hypothetical protein
MVFEQSIVKSAPFKITSFKTAFSNDTEVRSALKKLAPVKFDGLVRSRHTRESGYPGVKYMFEKTGFPFVRE